MFFSFLLKFILNKKRQFREKDFLKNEVDCFNRFACQRFRVFLKAISGLSLCSKGMRPFCLSICPRKTLDFLGLNIYIC